MDGLSVKINLREGREGVEVESITVDSGDDAITFTPYTILHAEELMKLGRIGDLTEVEVVLAP